MPTRAVTSWLASAILRKFPHIRLAPEVLAAARSNKVGEETAVRASAAAAEDRLATVARAVMPAPVATLAEMVARAVVPVRAAARAGAAARAVVLVQAVAAEQVAA